MLSKLLIITSLLASMVFAGDIEIQNAYVRAVPPNVTNSASFMKIINKTNKDKVLLSADSNIAKNVELHEHTMANGMMKMQQVKSILIPANSTVELKPGGYHVMLIGLHRKLKPNETVDFITLNFADKTSISVKNIPIKTVMSSMKM
jgi:copper(I)-binding protein